MREETAKKTLDLFQKNFELTPEEIIMDKPVRELGLNSLGFIKLVVDLENEFDVDFDDDDLEAGDKSINDLIDFLESMGGEA